MPGPVAVAAAVIDDAAKDGEQAGRPVDFIDHDEPTTLRPEEAVGIFQPTEVGAPFEIEIDGGVAPGVGNGPSQRCLADLPGSEKDDRGRRAEAGDYRLDQLSPYHITVN